MQSIRFQGPVTALKLDGELLLAGIGRCIYVYKWTTGELQAKHQVFSLDKIHGISIRDGLLAVWGGKSVKFLMLAKLDDKVPSYEVNDWIVSVSLAGNSALIQTAHNEVITFDLAGAKITATKRCSECSILYSGNLYPAKNLCAAGTVLGGVVVWNFNTQEIKFNFTDHEGSIFYVEFSPCGNFLASCSDDRSIIVWDLNTGLAVGRGWGHASRIWQLRFTDDGSLLSCSEDCTTKLWKVNREQGTLDQIQTFHGHQGRNVWSLSTVAYEDDIILATGGGDGRIKLQNITQTEHTDEWTIEDVVGRPEKNEHFKDFKKHRNKFVLTTSTGKVFLKNGQSWDQLPYIKLDEYSVVRVVNDTLVVAARDGRFLVVVDEPYLFTVELGAKLYELFPLILDGVTCMLLQTQNPQEPFRIVDLKGNLLKTLPSIPTFMVTSAKMFNDILFVGSRAGAVATWYQGDWQVNRRIFQSQDTITSFTIIGSNIMITCRSGHYGLFSADAELAARYTNKLQRGSIERVQIQSNGTTLFFGFKTNKFFIWDSTHDNEVVAEVCGGAHRAWCVDVDIEDESSFELYFIKAGRLCSISKPGNKHFKATMLLSGNHGREIRGLEFSSAYPGLLATASEDTCVNLSLVDGNDFVHTKLSLRHHVSGIQALHWSKCGRYLLTSGGREELIWWNVTVDDENVYAMEAGRLPTVSKTPDLRVMDFDVLEVEDGHIVAAGYSDSTLRLWKFADHKFELLAVQKYRECCILNVHLLEGLLIASATDGHLVAWDIRGWKFGNQLLRYAIHQSGVRCSEIQRVGNVLHHFSGGDDNALVAIAIDESFLVKELFRHADAHSSTLSALVVTADALYTTGCDQKIRAWSLNGEPRGTLHTSVADTGTLARQGDMLIAGGMGLATFQLA